MTQEELRAAAHKQPFEPFRVVLTTGTTYDIRHPDLIMVGHRSAIIGMTKNPDATAFDLTMKVNLLHINCHKFCKPLPILSSSMMLTLKPPLSISGYT